MGIDFNRLSVLVVEDTDPMRKLIVSVLGSLGVGQVYCAGSCEVGFHTYCTKQPDIVLTDWYMPPGDGLELVHQIRTSPFSPNTMVPIILMTGYSALPRVSAARDKGVTEFLVKPFSAADLSRRIAYVINKPRDFIQSENFFGPDRRRMDNSNYIGPRKRTVDREETQINKNIVEIG